MSSDLLFAQQQCVFQLVYCFNFGLGGVCEFVNLFQTLMLLLKVPRLSACQGYARLNIELEARVVI